MGVAKSDFCQMRRSDLGLIKNMERFARIYLDRSIFEKERNHEMQDNLDVVKAVKQC